MILFFAFDRLLYDVEWVCKIGISFVLVLPLNDHVRYDRCTKRAFPICEKSVCKVLLRMSCGITESIGEPGPGF